MAEAGQPPAETAEPAEEAPAGGGDQDNEQAVVETKSKIEALTKSSHKALLHHSFDDGERVEVDRTALEAILDVGARLKDIQKKSKVSMSTLALAHESYKDKQVNKF